ncbi:MAG: sulfatase-like hydrolase/transferase [Planctomycetota bacterium]
MFRFASLSVYCLLVCATNLRADDDVAADDVAAERPNIVLLMSDDLGWKDLGCYGGPVNTPTLDQLASRGKRFTDFYSGAAVCSPSRAALLTGRTNLRCGIYSWINDRDQRTHLPLREITLAEVLGAAGYETAHIGKWHLGMPSNANPDKPTPEEHGFHTWFATANNALPSHFCPNNFIRNGDRVGTLDGYACDLVVDEAIRWLGHRKKKDAPFFLNLWFHEPHAPLAAPKHSTAPYGNSSDPAALYSGTIANTDQAIERLLNRLHEIDQPENTIIIYTSDNGSYRSDRVGHLRGTKGSNYEGGIRVPGIFFWPTHISPSVSSQPAGAVDILPTVCGLVGIDPPTLPLDGTDLSDFLTDKADRIVRKQPLFWFLPLSGPALAMRDGRYAMVAYRKGELPRDRQAIAAVKERIATTLRDKGLFETETRGSTFEKQLFEGFSDRDADRLRGQFIRLNQFSESWIPQLKQTQFHRFELYDLARDPSQSKDLALQLPQVHFRMKTRLQALAAEVLDEAFDWSSSRTPPREFESNRSGVHRLESTYRSPFDAFVYVNRIPVEPEVGESPDDLAGRILGRLANQEGRILIKLPPGMNRASYLGFKTALESSAASRAGRCFECHRLPALENKRSNPIVPSLRNRSYTQQQLQDIMCSQDHAGLSIEADDANQLHALLQTLTDVSDERFRELILESRVLDTSGDFE